ncbi:MULTISPECIES: chorismate mutase [unclassified Enterococcus]|uniref:chorismate mutase n=1 Tax=unclassified Enterococcus TaxID=2608891 RepID=UPI0015565D89|nr:MULTISPECIES: chorismate mutase [unclassified Enterococcus]MBS7578205.1 chorismate mutase [Enterococcus sp. MMGLQ5-2]MBS7585419.1 chorismate mutase [Enterococcus sp. MMGLQ5-1]NPD13276.1 chorismate mutase [Enterococcus sp. MMGLQ5-1]NPD38036.1 chorismate mutase [Enterococcus sp. MMGLQ5-2]
MEIEDIRREIDQIDGELVALLEKRMDAVVEIVEYKKNTGKAIFDGEREQEVLKKIATLVNNKVHQETVVATFSDIMKNSRNFQEKVLK